jgi:two-component system, sporulation sensor kinase E
MDDRSPDKSAKINNGRMCRVNLHNLLNTIDELLFVLDGQDRIIGINQSLENHLGYTLDDLQGLPATGLYAPGLCDEAALIISDMFAGKQTLCSLPLLTKDGRVLPVETRATIGQWDNKDALFCISRDISGRNLYEQALELSERRYRGIVEDQTELICRFLPDTRHTFINEAYCRYYGKSRAELMGKEFITMILEVDQDKFVSHLASLNNENPISTIEHRVILPDGSIRWQQWSDRAIFNKLGQLVEYQSVGRDITEKKLAEETLKAERYRLFSLLERLPAFVCLIAPDYSIHFTNINFRKRFGEVKGRLCFELFNDLNQPCGDCPTHTVLQTGTPVEYEWESPQGDIFQIFDYPFHDIDGTLLVLELMVDITERKHMEDKLRLSEERFFKAFNASPALMIMRSLKDMRCLDVNDHCLRFTGYSRGELVGTTLAELSIFDSQSMHEVIQKVLLQGNCSNYEIPIRKKSGDLRTGLLSAEIIYLDGEQALLSVVNDITDLKQLEKEMARLDRLNLVGKMAAIIAHEIRNPLTTVKGFLQLLRDKDRYDQDREYFNLMIEELEIANSIITDFLSLTKNKAVELKKTDLNIILKTIIPLIEAYAMRDNKKICLDLGDIPHLLLDKKELHQVIFNLTRNGLDAMHPGGHLFIKTYPEDGEIVLAVNDQGEGIKPELLEKLGTPFFTTKETGTGLGLAVCYSIAARHNARIEISTGPGGTTFFVKFKLH